MSIDPQRLLDWHVPETRHMLTRRDVAFYALSVGLGQDPVDVDQHTFVDPGSDALKALPSMALILAYPGFWLGEPETGVDAAKVIHAEQSIEILRALPLEGTLVGHTRVTDLIDTGAQKGSVLYSEREIRDEDGSAYAIVRQVHLLRGNGGFDGWKQAVSHSPAAPLPDYEAPMAVLRLATRPEQALLYRLNGDANPLHIDPTVAARAGFARPILHGMCTFGVVGHALLKLACSYDTARFRGMSARFTSPVYPGETIQTELYADGRFRARAIERNQIVVDHGCLSLN
jgi:acyl dehydratase